MLSIRRSLAWMTLSQSGLFVLQFGSSVVLSRLLTPYDMGVYAVALAIVGLLTTLRSVGLTSYVVRAPELDHTLSASVFTINAALCLLMAALIAGLGMVGSAFLGEPGVKDVLRVLALLPLLGIAEFLPAAGLERHGDFRTIGVVNFFRTLVGTVVTIGLAFEGWSYMSLAYGQVAAGMIAVACFTAFGRRYVLMRLGLAGWRESCATACRCWPSPG